MCVIFNHKKNNALLFVEIDAVTNCGQNKARNVYVIREKETDGEEELS